MQSIKIVQTIQDVQLMPLAALVVYAYVAKGIF